MRTTLFVVIVVLAAATPVSPVVPPISDRVPSTIDKLLARLTSPFRDAQGTTVYTTEPVKRRDVIMTVQAAGTLNAVTTVDVGSQISGRIKALYADFNSNVTAGEVIARVEPAMYEARVAQARAELEMAKAQSAVQQGLIRQARAQIDTALANLEATEAEVRGMEAARKSALQELERSRSLARRSVIASEKLERVESAYAEAVARADAAAADRLSRAGAVRAVEAMMIVSEGRAMEAEALVKQKEAVLRQAMIDLDRTYIRAPITGIVIDRAVSGGQTIAASLNSPVLFTIAQDLSRMQIEASVVEADISRFEAGQRVTFTVDAYPDRSFTGSVREIRKAPQVVQNVVTYVVIVAADNPDELLLPGMTANLSVVIAERLDVLTVSNAALRFRPADAAVEAAGSSALVYIPRPSGEPMAIALRTGITDGRVSELLLGGLEEDSPVITGVSSGSGHDTNKSSVTVRFRFW